MKNLYPDIEPNITHQLEVGQGHTLMVEECGNAAGIPIVFLHGGPGSYCKSHHRCFFNPSIYRIILFDQRGAGRSTPSGNLQFNTTDHLLADMELIREKLNIDKWIIFGGSWGATLSLLYAQKHTDKVLGLILRSIFLARKSDVSWFYIEGGVNKYFPKQWQKFFELTSVNQEELLTTYYEALTGNDINIRNTAALTWAAWAGCVVSNGRFPEPTEVSEKLLNSVRIECHYLYHNHFIKENQLISNINKVANIPTVLIHGQKDLVCLPENSQLLKQHLPMAKLKLIPTGGHLSDDPAMISALVEATDEMGKLNILEG
ncbi:prolyl aminopeptidase [Candidatus Halobeggiatoa sp. HSG11]|nr:prolyl aminopeptidase [Candidatus Halobeggiatoa sp. HSG11]